MDYKYNEKDVSMMKVALKELKEENRRGQQIGLVISGMTGWWCRCRSR